MDRYKIDLDFSDCSDHDDDTPRVLIVDMQGTYPCPIVEVMLEAKYKNPPMPRIIEYKFPPRAGMDVVPYDTQLDHWEPPELASALVQWLNQH